MRHLAMTGISTTAMISRITLGEAMRATPPSARICAGTRSRAITATAPARWAISACRAVVTSMITPPLSISARPVLRRRLVVLCPLFCDIVGAFSLSRRMGALRRLSSFYNAEGVLPLPMLVFQQKNECYPYRDEGPTADRDNALDLLDSERALGSVRGTSIDSVGPETQDESDENSGR